MSDFIKTLGESNQDALAFKFPDDRGYVCSNLLCEVSTQAAGIGIMFLRNTKMFFVATLLNTQCTAMSNERTALDFNFLGGYSIIVELTGDRNWELWVLTEALRIEATTQGKFLLRGAGQSQ